MEKYILRFEVSMKDIVVVHVLHSIADLFENRPDLLLVEWSFVLQMLVKISITAELH